MRIVHCTAATLRAVLCYVDSGITPSIAFDRDDLAYPLARKLRETLRDKGGSQPVMLIFNGDEAELQRQFEGVCWSIHDIFTQLKGDFTCTNQPRLTSTGHDG